MANLTESSTWDTVYQLESTDQALGGAGGTMNRQAQALLNRTKYLADTKLNTADFKTQINASGSAPVYAARAWVNFNGTGTVAIRASGNVSSITDNGVGNYTVNFTTAMTDTNYSAIANYNKANTAVTASNDGNASCAAYLTTSVSLAVMDGAASAQDAACISVSIFR